MNKINPIQLLAKSLIRSDAEFLYKLVQLSGKANNNYITMSLPYIGIFADGAAQWGQKTGIASVKFSEEEKGYYIYLRNQHKLFSLSYEDFYSKLKEEYTASDTYFYEARSWIEKNIIGYNNVGVDYCNQYPCGNTILCGIYTMFSPVREVVDGEKIKRLSIIAGKLCAFYEGINGEYLNIDPKFKFRYKDYHFFGNCPLGINEDFNRFCLYSLLCSINYTIYFIDGFFKTEIPTKLRFAYLQYYYLTDMIKEVNQNLGTHFQMNEALKNDDFRNCMAHYGLSQVLREIDLIEGDIMGGLTNKIFQKGYIEVKQFIINELTHFKMQLENYLSI